MSILLDSNADGTDVPASSFELPAVSAVGGDVLTIAFIQNRAALDLSSAGWTLRENEVITPGGIPEGIQYAMLDRFHAVDASPYHDVMDASGACRWGAAQMAFRTHGTSVPHHGGNHAVYGDPGASNPSLIAALGGAAGAGNVLVAYASWTSNIPATFTGFNWPAGWSVLEAIPGQATFIGNAEVAYKVADGSETSVEVELEATGVQSFTVLVGEYEIVADEGPSQAIGWDALAAEDPNGPILAAIQRDDTAIAGATDRSIRVELNGTGQGSFKINRYSPVALEAILARGNVIKCRFPWRDDYDFGFLLEKGDFTLAHAQEHGGEEFSFSGRGLLAYLDRGVMDAVAYTTGLDTEDRLVEVWHTNKAPKPTGVAFVPADAGHVYVIGSRTRRIYKIRQSDRALVKTGPVLWAGTDHWAAGLSADPSDSDILWALEAPWLAGSGANTKIHKVDRATLAVISTINLGSPTQLTDIRVSTSNTWTTRWDTNHVQKRNKATGGVVTNYTVVYKGNNQVKPNGVAISENGTGTEIAMWFGGTSAGGVKRALVADLSDPSTVTRTINTSDIASYGGDWSDEGGNEFFYMVSGVLGLTWKYQLTAAVPHDPRGGTWRLDEGSPGAILWRVLQEAQAAGRPQHPFPDLTYDFTQAVDSNGAAWDEHDGTLEFDAKVTESILAVALRLLPYGLVEQMSPYLKLGGYNADTYGADRTGGGFAPGVVRFAKGANIIPELGRQERERPLHSHMLALGKNGIYARAVLADLGYVREGGLTTDVTDETALEGQAEAALDDERVKSERIRFKVPIGDDVDAGLYLPFTHYNVGDLVTLHSGSGEHDFNNEPFLLYAFTLEESSSGKWETAIVELGSATIVETTPTTGSNGGSGGGGTGGGGPTITDTAITVEGLDDDTGVTITSAIGSKLRVLGAQVYQEGADVIRMVIQAANRLLQLEDVDADGVADHQTLVWDEASGTFIPGNIEDLATAETDPTKRLAPDGAGRVAWVTDTSGAGAMVPYFIEDGDTFTVPENKQALFSETIAGPGLLVVEGMLIEVD